LYKLEEMPDTLGRMTSLESLTIAECLKLKTVPASIGRMTSLESLMIDYCPELKTVPASIGQLGTLKHLTIGGLHKLEAMPDTLGSLTSLERLTLITCSKLKALPASIMHLSRLQKLNVVCCPLQDMPCIEALTALRNLHLDVTDYTQENRTFMALSRSLPCLQQLDTLRFSAYAEPDQDGGRYPVALRAEDVLAVGRALRAWPLPLIRDVPNESAKIGIRLSTCWQALGLPAAAADWSNATTLEFFRVQQHKMAAFASGMHARLGAASEVSRLDEQTLVMIADELLGGWGLLREWRQQEGAGAGGGSC